MALTASALAICGCDCVSLEVYSTLRPRMPPAALISFTASFTPSLKLVPDVAPVPDSSTSPKILTDWVWPRSGCASARLRKKAEIRAMERIGFDDPRYLNSLWTRRVTVQIQFSLGCGPRGTRIAVLTYRKCLSVTAMRCRLG